MERGQKGKQVSIYTAARGNGQTPSADFVLCPKAFCNWPLVRKGEDWASVRDVDLLLRLLAMAVKKQARQIHNQAKANGRHYIQRQRANGDPSKVKAAGKVGYARKIRQLRADRAALGDVVLRFESTRDLLVALGRSIKPTNYKSVLASIRFWCETAVDFEPGDHRHGPWLAIERHDKAITITVAAHLLGMLSQNFIKLPLPLPASAPVFNLSCWLKAWEKQTMVRLSAKKIRRMGFGGRLRNPGDVLARANKYLVTAYTAKADATGVVTFAKPVIAKPTNGVKFYDPSDPISVDFMARRLRRIGEPIALKDSAIKGTLTEIVQKWTNPPEPKLTNEERIAAAMQDDGWVEDPLGAWN